MTADREPVDTLSILDDHYAAEAAGQMATANDRERRRRLPIQSKRARPVRRSRPGKRADRKTATAPWLDSCNAQSDVAWALTKRSAKEKQRRTRQGDAKGWAPVAHPVLHMLGSRWWDQPLRPSCKRPVRAGGRPSQRARHRGRSALRSRRGASFLWRRRAPPSRSQLTPWASVTARPYNPAVASIPTSTVRHDVTGVEAHYALLSNAVV